MLNTHVEKILIEDGKAAGVQLRGGDIIKAEHAVVANAPVWALPKLLPEEVIFFVFDVYTFTNLAIFERLHADGV